MRKVAAIFLTLQVLEIACMYRELRAVKYKVFNYERMVHVITCFCNSLNNSKEAASAAETVVVQEQGEEGEVVIPSSAAMTNTSSAINGSGTGHNNKGGGSRSSNGSDTIVDIPTPDEVAVTERIFLPPKHLSRRKVAFGSLGRAKLSPEELTALTSLFQPERFLLVVGADVKNKSTNNHNRFQFLNRWRKKKGHHRDDDDKVDDASEMKRQVNCHIVLHEDASNKDIVKSTLALTLLRQKLAKADHLDPEQMRSSDCMDLIEDAYRECDRTFGSLLRELTKKGWESPARFMFGRVHMRAFWPLQQSNKVRRPEQPT